ncbi:MAG: hypothetical protein JNL70_09860 [Saprospiraceae bacterium]|nr:hypothetical protein [Saprospiraceae bacterium]
MKKLFFFTILSFCFAQCTQVITPETPLSNKISFSNLQVGQESRYNLLTARNYMIDSDTTFKNGNDTLILRIESQDSYGFKVSESHTSMKVATFYYYFEVVGDSLFVKPLPQTTEVNSMVLGYSKSKYSLKDANQPVIELNRWWSPKQSRALWRVWVERKMY